MIGLRVKEAFPGRSLGNSPLNYSDLVCLSGAVVCDSALEWETGLGRLRLVRRAFLKCNAFV